MNKIIPRILLDFIIAAAVIGGLWYIALPLSLAGLWFCPGYVEIIVAGIVYDSLFGLIPGMGIEAYAGTIVTVVMFAVVLGLKRVLRK